MGVWLYSIAHHLDTAHEATLLLSQLHTCKVVDSAHLDQLHNSLAPLLTIVVKVGWVIQILTILTLHLRALSYLRSVVIMGMAGSKERKTVIQCFFQPETEPWCQFPRHCLSQSKRGYIQNLVSRKPFYHLLKVIRKAFLVTSTNEYFGFVVFLNFILWYILQNYFQQNLCVCVSVSFSSK